LVDGQAIEIRVGLIGDVDLGFLLAGPDVETDMEAVWELLVVVDWLELMRWYEDPGIAFVWV
jgi:hypothetical protein